VRAAVGLGALDVGIDPPQKPLAMVLDGLLDPPDVDQVIPRPRIISRRP
jgi:hypothetical protein